MPDKNIKILIIGFGSIGGRHYRNLCGLGFGNVFVYDVDQKKSKDKGVKAVANIDKKTLRQFDVAFICNPTDKHVKTAIKCAQARCHLFIEKPLSHNLNKIDELEKICKQNKLVIMIACNYLFNDAFQKMKEALRKKLFGRPLISRAVSEYHLPDYYRSYKNIYSTQKNGGVMLDYGSHIFYYLQDLLGEIKSGAVLRGGTNHLGIRSEETAVATFEHQGGVLSSAVVDYVRRGREHRVEVVTSKGMLTLNFEDDTVKFKDGKKVKILYNGEKDLNRMFVDEIKYFLTCVHKKIQPRHNLKEGRKSVEILSRVNKNRSKNKLV